MCVRVCVRACVHTCVCVLLQLERVCVKFTLFIHVNEYDVCLPGNLLTAADAYNR